MTMRPGSTDPETRRQREQRLIAGMIRAARRRAGLTQEALALRMTQLGTPVTRGQISMWETSQMPGAYKLVALVHAVVSVARPRGEGDRELDRLLDAFGQLGRLDDEDQPPRRQDI